ncbi:PREDICTED: two pore potassium channel protein sup-9-like [Priapulus caudatus]|uniref:Two pore potassium channel protein sup-9-like n=1 Tax=Priapulus caudatus TaxID=37621 RepID=A0ABM1E9L0_PRICU|nr:PREDICTED: two pore potassium channel protein sup-9-like [Priapulus caudatus]
MKRKTVRTLSLIVCTFTYLLVGAAVFDALESDKEMETRQLLKSLESRLMEKYNVSEEDYRRLSHAITFRIPHKAGRQWKFAGAFFFAATVITTIGYGQATPRTIGGKLFCMFYALAGIPLGLVMFQSVGERLNTFFAFVIRHIKKALKMKNENEVSDKTLIGVGTTLSGMVTFAGAAAFSNFEENWSYFDALYYCLITVTTIGFGDLVALQENQDLNERPEYVAFSLIFIIVGLIVAGACINLVVLKFFTLNMENLEDKSEEPSPFALDGDIVVTANGPIDTVDDAQQPDNLSVCSCSCYGEGGLFRSGKRPPQKYSRTNKENMYNCTEDVDAFMKCELLNQKRASI